MRDYGKVYSSFWSSQTIRDMSEDARNLALYLLTCPHGTIAGVFRLPDGYACEDLQWPAERVQKGFVELFRKGFANRCETTKWVFIREHLDWNKPENPNQWKAARKIADQVPAECVWAIEYKQVFAIASGEQLEPLANPSETLSEPVAVAVAVTVTEAVTGESGSDAALPEHAKPTKSKLDYSCWPDQPSAQVMADWLAMRKRLKADVSQTAINRLAKHLHDAAGAGYSVDDCLGECVAKGWKGFELAWLENARAQRPAGRVSIADQNRQAIAEFRANHSVIEGELLENHTHA
jgi:hypothetical protein